MASKALTLCLLVATLVGASAATSPEPVFYPRTPHTPPSLGRHPFLSHRQLIKLLANDTPLVDPTGSIRPEEIPPPTPVTCGKRMPGTAHTVQCNAAAPLSGIVLVPPRRATASLVLLHGYTDVPYIYLTLLKVLLKSKPNAWSSVRVVLPFAPRVPVQLEDAELDNPYAWYDASPTFITTLSDVVEGNITDVDAVERRVLTAKEDVDSLGLFLSTRRIEAIVAAEHRELTRGGGNRRPAGGSPTGRVVLAGHSLGAVMATHVSLTSRVRLAAVVALQGFVADAPRLNRVPGTVAGGDRGYPVELVSGSADVAVPPSLVAASASIVRRLLRGKARVGYTEQRGVTHTSFFLAGPDADAVAQVLTRYLG
ncbi:hypothetical protein MMPV_002588 [Pyropia vietnamensis]